MTIKDLDFFVDPHKRKVGNQPTFGTLRFARHTSLCYANIKEPNLSVPQLNSSQDYYILLKTKFYEFKNNFNIFFISNTIVN